MTTPTPFPDPAVLVKALERIKRDWAMHSNTKNCCDPFTVADEALETYRALPSTPRVPERPAAQIAEEVWGKACFSSNPNAMIDAITEAVEADRQGRRGTP
jgi:hypothetical protein